jgi:ADP-ribosylglycohydrolase
MSLNLAYRLSRVRGSIVGAIVGDCLGTVGSADPQPFVMVAQITDPLELNDKMVKYQDLHIYQGSADSRAILTVMDLTWKNDAADLLDSDMQARFRELLKSSLENMNDVSISLKKSLSGNFANELSTNCALVRAIPSAFLLKNRIKALVHATHNSNNVVEGGEILAKLIQDIALNDKPGSVECFSHEQQPGLSHNFISKFKALKSLSDSIPAEVLPDKLSVKQLMAIWDEYEDSTHLQDKFHQKIRGFGADSSLSLCSAMFALDQATKMSHLDKLILSEYELKNFMPSNLHVLDAKYRSKNLQANSNRLDSIKAFERENPYLVRESPFVHCINWALSLGGDGRTNACLAGALAGAKWGIEAIPEPWISYSENARAADKKIQTFNFMK